MKRVVLLQGRLTGAEIKDHSTVRLLLHDKNMVGHHHDVPNEHADVIVRDGFRHRIRYVLEIDADEDAPPETTAAMAKREACAEVVACLRRKIAGIERTVAMDDIPDRARLRGLSTALSEIVVEFERGAKVGG